MITVRLKNTYQVPSRWTDFLPEHRAQFVELCGCMEDFEKGLLTFDQFRILATMAIAGIDAEKIKLSTKSEDNLYENIFRLSELLDFPYELKDNEDGSRTAYLSISLYRNVLQAGYRMEVSPSGLVDSDLTSEQYVDGLELTDLYTRTRSEDALQRLCNTLGGRGLSRREMVAMYYNFRGLLNWLQTLPQYSLLFRKGDSRKSGDSPLGLASSIFSLSKSGYGTLKEIKELDFMSYLGALVQMSIESIRQLSSIGMNPGEIADKLNLPVSEILPHITDDYNERSI